MRAKIYEAVNELDSATYSLEDVRTLLWTVCENYFDISQEQLNKDSAARAHFVCNYDRISEITNIATVMLDQTISRYKQLSDEITSIHKALDRVMEEGR